MVLRPFPAVPPPATSPSTPAVPACPSGASARAGATPTEPSPASSARRTGCANRQQPQDADPVHVFDLVGDHLEGLRADADSRRDRPDRRAPAQPLRDRPVSRSPASRSSSWPPPSPSSTPLNQGGADYGQPRGRDTRPRSAEPGATTSPANTHSDRESPNSRGIRDSRLREVTSFTPLHPPISRPAANAASTRQDVRRPSAHARDATGISQDPDQFRSNPPFFLTKSTVSAGQRPCARRTTSRRRTCW